MQYIHGLAKPITRSPQIMTTSDKVHFLKDIFQRLDQWSTKEDLILLLKRNSPTSSLLNINHQLLLSFVCIFCVWVFLTPFFSVNFSFLQNYLQSNLSIADMVYNGHLVKVNTVSRNQSNHGQTLRNSQRKLYIADTFMADML